jgi:hypothetical protein
MLKQVRQPSLLVLAAWAAVLLCACGPANERPASGAVPGSRTVATPPGVPPTLSPSDALRFRTLGTPSPGLGGTAADPSPAASPSTVASPSTAPTPPIVRTIVPSPNSRVAPGAVSVSAVLVGRGADLASASLSVNGADSGAQIDKRSAREWSIHASPPLAEGTHTARVLVRDATGASGGFTWQFSVGPSVEPAPPAQEPAPAASPGARSRTP